MMIKRVKIVVLINLLLILTLTLFPFNFSPEKLSVREITKGFHHVSNTLDFIFNIWLFVPFGFSCSWLMQLRNRRASEKVLAVVAISLSLAITIECLQLFLPDRFSTKADIIANGLGGLIGCLSFMLWNYRSSNLWARLKTFFKPRYLILLLVSYLSIMIWLTVPLAKATTLDNWSTNYPLILGNEATGDRPWQGYIDRLAILNRAFSANEIQYFLNRGNLALKSRHSLVAYYQLSETESYPDTTGKLPPLTWQGNVMLDRQAAQKKEGVRITNRQWLATANPSRLMSDKIRQTSQFTLCVIFATADLEQTGPARIVSLSSDPYHRNFTLAQESKNLIFRLRTPLMGENGTNVEFSIPNVLQDDNYHSLAIVYDDSTLKIYVDHLHQIYSWQLVPEVAFFEKLFSTRFSYKSMLSYKILYYLLVFVPLGLLLGLSSPTAKDRPILRSLLPSIGIIFPAGALQRFIATGNHINLNLINFWLSIAIAAITFCLVRSKRPSQILSKS